MKNNAMQILLKHLAASGDIKESDLNIHIGNALKEWRESKNMTRKQLAVILQFDEQTIKRREQGEGLSFYYFLVLSKNFPDSSFWLEMFLNVYNDPIKKEKTDLIIQKLNSADVPEQLLDIILNLVNLNIVEDKNEIQ